MVDWYAHSCNFDYRGSNLTGQVQCPHCDFKFDLTLEPQVNFTRVWLHMVAEHFEIAFATLVKFNKLQLETVPEQ